MLKQLDTLIGFAVVMLVVSLVITIVTQMVSAFLGLRGKNLIDALRVMIFKIAPNIPPNEAQDLVKHVLTHCAISDSAMSMASKWLDRVPGLKWLRQRWKTASAIRPDELYDILKQIGAGSLTKTAAVGDAAITRAPAALSGTATEVLTRLVQTVEPRTTDAITVVALHAEQLVGKEIGEAKAMIERYATVTDAAFVNLERWFNSSQERAQQWFTLHMRLITVAAAFIAAFVLQLDTIALIKRISTDSDMRAKLVAVSGPIQQQASKALDATQSSVIDQATHQAAIAELAKTYQLPKGLGDHGNFASLNEAKTWLAQQLGSDPKGAAIVDSYEGLVTNAKLDAYLATIQKLVSTSGLDLLPEPYPLQLSPGWTKGRRLPHLFITNGEWSWPKRRLLGILVSAALLSLGAPFWFNTLKSLTNLRPTLANAIEKKPNQSTSKSGG
ncbi:MAG TPA: hypothetical protein VGW39_01615 [Chthoniobacterales bacterium]|nr:hypothetical protein [Chthoniobacterales bacterium]